MEAHPPAYTGARMGFALNNTLYERYLQGISLFKTLRWNKNELNTLN